MRYRFYTNENGKTVCVSSYAGKAVRATAKCAPSDSYNSAIGEDLARARVDVKIAEKRYANAQRKYQEAMDAAFKANKHLTAMEEYMYDAATALDNANGDLQEILSEV